jgi:hypothetical protein
VTETAWRRRSRLSLADAAASSASGGVDPPADEGHADDLGPWSGAARAALSIGLVVAAVGLFVLAEWHVAVFRRGMGRLAPRMATLLYVATAVALLWSVVRRFRAHTADGADAGGRRSPPRFPRVLALPAAMSGSIMAFLIPLFGAWEGTFRPTMNLAGIVPYSDGTLWFGGAERLLFNGSVDDYVGKRPLNPALFAMRLALTNVDLRLAMVLEAVFLGVACCLVAMVVARHLGAPAGLALFAGIFGFVGPFAASTFTESLGVAFGALAVCLLWPALHDRDPRLFAGGLFLLTVALSARPGAIAVVLLLPLWFAWAARREEDRLVAWPALGLGVAAVIAGVAMNLAASLSTGGNPANLNSNSMYMVYGLATGYPGWDLTRQGWGRAFDDHPEIIPLDDSERAVVVRRLALRAVADDPFRFANSLFQSEVNYLRLVVRHAVVTPNLPVRIGVVAAGLGLAALALSRRRRERVPLLLDLGLFLAAMLCLPVFLLWGAVTGLPWWTGCALALVFYGAFVLVGSARLLSSTHAGFLLVAMVGVVLSVPLIGLDGSRVLAATAPLMTLPLAIAVSVLARGTDQVPAQPVGTAAGGNRWSPAILGAAVVAVAVLGAPLAAAAVEKPRVAGRSCPDGRRAHALLGASSVRIVDDATNADGGLDTIDIEDALTDVAIMPGLAVVRDLIRPGTTIVAGVNERGDDRIVFLTGNVRASGSSVLHFCGDELGDNISAVFTLGFWPKPVTFAFMTGTPLVP